MTALQRLSAACKAGITDCNFYLYAKTIRPRPSRVKFSPQITTSFPNLNQKEIKTTRFVAFAREELRLPAASRLGQLDHQVNVGAGNIPFRGAPNRRSQLTSCKSGL
jgi:hypothetical protein